jgi:DNA-binding HxlR family transcriptional regulator
MTPTNRSTRQEQRFFDALGHPTRIKILQVLSEKPLGFSELKRGTGIESNGLLSFHLGKLTGLVKTNAEGSYALTEEGGEALRMVEASKKQTQEGQMQRPSVRVPHLRTILTGLVVVLVILAAASAIEYGQIQALDSRTQPSLQTVTDTATVTTSITTIATTTATTTVTSTVTSVPDGPPVYKADQVVPIEVNNSEAGIGSTFMPNSVRLVVGINNSISFINNGTGFVGVQSLKWPTNASGFMSGILGHNESWSTTLTVPGVYIVNNYLRPVLGNISILVAEVPNISASTSSGNTISISGLSICASGCSAGQTLSASIIAEGDSPLAGLVLYLNGTSEGTTVLNDSMTNFTYQYSANLVDSSIPIVNGETYFVELVAIFANNQLAVATASAGAT